MNAAGTARPDTPAAAVDLDAARIATDPPARLRPFNLAGVLGPAEIHGARTVSDLTGETRPDVLLAAALALRAPQYGHVCIELSTVADAVTADEDAPLTLADLEWPEPTAWRSQLADSPLVSVRPPGTPRPDPAHDRPLTLVGDRLYLDRYWRYERRVAEVLHRRADRLDGSVQPDLVRAVLDRLLPPGRERPDRQRLAVATAAHRHLTVIAGGPGTGKTWTVARLIALLHEVAEAHPPRIAVAAPTGKAADRLTAALRAAAGAIDTAPTVRDRLARIQASTLHRLLGWQPGARTRFRHDRSHKLPHEVVVVDETSMVDLPLMAKLLQALRRDAKLILVGDPDQLASVEAGAVLADVVGPTDERIRRSDSERSWLVAATGEALHGAGPPRDGGIDDSIVMLGTVRRFRAASGVARLAAAVHAGSADDTVAALSSDAGDVTWIPAPGDAADAAAFDDVRQRVVAANRTVHRGAVEGRAADALDAVGRLRVLTAHRRGPVGAAGWVRLIEHWLTEDVPAYDATSPWYVGQPVMITRNEPLLGLYNGDVGVVVADGDRLTVALGDGDDVRLLGPGRLQDVETVHAMTIHKSQGSQFDAVVVVLPDASSPLLTRELLYTAVTRTTGSLVVVGSEAAVRAAVTRRVTRASGLRETLWGGHG